LPMTGVREVPQVLKCGRYTHVNNRQTFRK
jgi:hypothetical protein